MTNSLGGVHNSLGGGTVIFHRRGYIRISTYAYIRIFIYVYMLIYGYTYIRLYATVCDGMQWYAMVCNQRMQWDAMAYNGMQRYAIDCGIFTT